MADHLTKKKRSWNMSRIGSKNTKPEIIVRKFLYSKGFRYRLHNKKILGNPDISNQKEKTVIFINGCFWHRHGCKKTTTPKTNIKFWKNKFEENEKRDKKNYEKLINEGWRVCIVWECEVFEKDLNELLSDVLPMH